MFEVVKRRGSFTEELPAASTFADRSEAEIWARNYLESHPDKFQRGLEAVEVQRSERPEYGGTERLEG